MGLQPQGLGTSLRNLTTGVSAIPSSEADQKLIHRWYLGENDPFVDQIGTADATNNGAIESSGDWVDGAAYNSDGTDDYVDLTTLGSLGSSMSTDFAIAFSIQTTQVGDFIFGADNSSDGTELVATSGNVWGGPAGTVEWSIADQDGNRSRVYSNTTIDDGVQYRVVLNKTGDSSNDLDIWINQTQDTTTSDKDTGFSSPTDLDVFLALFAWNNGGTIDRFLDSSIDDLCIFGDSLTQSEIESYQNPWESVVTDYHTTLPLRRAYNSVMEPSAQYVASEDKTFHVYHVETDAYARHYDHATGTWGPENLVAEGTYDNQHGAPILLVDSNGIIHVWFNGHGENSNMYYVQSDNAYDVSAWTTQSTDFQNDDGVYPKAIEISGTIYLFDPQGNLTDGRPERLYESGDGGSTWSSQDIIDFTANDKSIYCTNAIPDGDDVHLFWRVFDDPNSKMEKVMHAVYNVANDTLQAQDGTSLTIPLNETEADSNCLVSDESGDTGTGVGVHNMELDSNGIPYLTWTVPDTDSTDVLIKWSYWNGTDWTSSSTITTTGSRLDGGVLIANSSTDIDFYATINTRQEIHRFNWDGSTWTDAETIQTAGDYDLFAPQGVRDATSETKAIWSEDTEDRTINAKTYAYGNDGFVTKEQ